jgi:hypothetical protein
VTSDRGAVTFRDLDDVETRRDAVADLVARWVGA